MTMVLDDGVPGIMNGRMKGQRRWWPTPAGATYRNGHVIHFHLGILAGLMDDSAGYPGIL